MFTSHAREIISVSEAAEAIIAKDMPDREDEQDPCEPPSRDYEDIAEAAESISDLADQYPDPALKIKAAELHEDAALEAGNSTGEYLFTLMELYHLTEAKYYRLLASGLNEADAESESKEFYREMSMNKRHLIPEV